jgi:colicin import membrane protein
MATQSFWQLLKTHPFALAASIGLHLVLIVLLSISLITSKVREPVSVEKPTIKAEVVDATQVDAEIEKLKQAEQKKLRDAQAQQQQIEREKEKLRKQLEDEKKRLAKIKNEQQELKQRKLKEQQELKARKQKEQQKEKKRLAALEQKRKQEAERQKRAEEERIRAEQEKQRKAEEARVKAEEDRRKAEELRKAEEERQKRLAAEAEQRRIAEEAELKLRLAEEERRVAAHNVMLKSLRTQYVKLIEQKVERNWLRPPSFQTSELCEVYVRQTALGDVISVNVQACSSDVAFRNSIERAVWKASPLPPPPNPEVFDNEIRFTFRPQT